MIAAVPPCVFVRLCAAGHGACFGAPLLRPASPHCPPAQVYACLLELRVGAVNGFDLSALNAYWWHPGAERMELARMPHRRLSAPFAVHCLDLQARVDAALARQAAAANSNSDSAAASGSQGAEAAEEANSPPSSASGSRNESEEEAAWEHDAWLDVPVTAAGHWNAVAFWFEVHAGGGAAVTSWGEGRGSEASSGDGGEAAAGEAAAEGRTPAAAPSWGQAVQYLDGQAVTAGSSVRLRVRQDGGQLVFTSDPPQCRPRHALGEPGHVTAAAALPAVLLAGVNGMGLERALIQVRPNLPDSTLTPHFLLCITLPPQFPAGTLTWCWMRSATMRMRPPLGGRCSASARQGAPSCWPWTWVPVPACCP